MSVIDKIKLSDGVESVIVDAEARDRLDAVEDQLGSIPDTTVLSRLQDTVEQNVSDIASVAGKANANTSAITDLQSSAKENAETIADVKAAAQQNAADIAVNKTAAEEADAAIATRVTQNEADIASLKSSKANAATVTALSERVTTIETNENTMQEDLTALEAKADGAISFIAIDGTKVTITKADGTSEELSTQDTTYTEATDTAAGLMSAADKAKLDGLSGSGGSGGDPNALAMLWGKEYSGNRTSTITRGSDGNPTSISETGDGNTATRTYSYDSDGRIIKETVSGTDPDGTYTKTKELTYGDSGATKIVETYQHTASDPTWADIAAKFKAGLGDIAYKVGDLFSEDWDHYTSSTSHTKYTAPWRYESSENITLEDGSTQTGGWIEFAYLTPFYMQFDNSEAFYAVGADGLTTGSYYVTRGSTNYNFTLTKDLSEGDRISFNGSSTSSVKSWEGDGKTLIETVTCTTGEATGTSLGTMQDYARNGQLNGYYVTLYGSGRWRDSAVRQWLNSTAAAGEWWKPQHEWDLIPDSPYMAHAGFLHGLPQELIDVMIPTKTIAYPASIYGNDPDVTYDKVILPSWGQMYTQEQYNAENEPLAYYKQLNGTSSRWGRTSTYAARKKYRLDSKSSSTYYWIRSAIRDDADSAWCVYSNGDGVYDYACYVNALAPLACIG